LVPAKDSGGLLMSTMGGIYCRHCKSALTVLRTWFGHTHTAKTSQSNIKLGPSVLQVLEPGFHDVVRRPQCGLQCRSDARLLLASCATLSEAGHRDKPAQPGRCAGVLCDDCCNHLSHDKMGAI
jgi:hypothetical protein